MDFTQYIKPELLILIPVLYLVGMALKKSTISDKHIPWILGVSGVLIAGIYVFATTPISGAQEVATALFTAITQGVLCAGASVFANQIIKQAKKED